MPHAVDLYNNIYGDYESDAEAAVLAFTAPIRGTQARGSLREARLRF